MKKVYIKIIGNKEEAREEALLRYVIEAEGLKDILDKDFEEWSNFDGWENIGGQQWIFARALEVYRGKKIDIKCGCCEYINCLEANLKKIDNQKCYGIKSAYMIEKVLGEIVLAAATRESDGTYSA